MSKPFERDANPNPPEGLVRADSDEQTLIGDTVVADGDGRLPTPLDDTRVATPDASFPRVDTLPEEFAAQLGRQAIAVGQVVGARYKLVEKLGGGAMGEVFVAENLAIGAKVAVKRLKKELLADTQFRQRFQREAEAIAAIEHPNVARFLDVVIGDPTFLVMEYVRGPTLAARLREARQLAPAEAVRIGVRLCWALQAAHAVGVIHRDLKPANVVLAPDVEHGEIPKVIDFGLAKLAARGDEQSLTRNGQLVGTPQYMAPEQVAGRAVDARSDIYSLASLVFELVAGQPPFAAPDDFQVLYKQLHEDPPPLRYLRPGAPAALEEVLARALSKNPEHRHANMPELAAALAASVAPSEPHMRAGAAAQPPRAGALPSPSTARAQPSPPATQAVPPTTAAAPRRKGPGGTLAFVGAIVVLLGFAGGYGASRLGRQRAAARLGSLFVLSQPSGALVELDGRALPQTTPTVAADLSPGAHSIKIERVGAAPVVQEVQVRAGERSAVQVTLPPITRRLDVRTVPDGASVYLDGHLVLGETPTTVALTEDEFHALRIEKTGFESLTHPLTPDDKDPVVNLTLQPEKQPRGAVIVDANGAGEVWLDGVNSGFTTPTLAIELPVGPHTVEVRDAAGRGQVSHITIAQGQTVHLLVGANPSPPAAP